MRKYDYIDLSRKRRKSPMVGKSMKILIFVPFILGVAILFWIPRPTFALPSFDFDLSSIFKTAKARKCGPAFYPSGKLEGAVLGSLFPLYLTSNTDNGILRVSDSIESDFCSQLKTLLEKKKGVSQSELDKIYNEYHSVAHSKSGVTSMTLEDYIEHGDKVVKKCHKSVTENCLRGSHPILRDQPNSRLKTSIELSKMIGARELIAIGLTEIMPSENGKTNAYALDYLLRYGGVEFVQFLPALNDSLYSFGPWQFTEYAVYEKGENRKGASWLNYCIPDDLQLPDDVRQLRGDDHIVAASLLATINIALWVASLPYGDFVDLQHRMGYDNFQQNLALFVALAHHRPDTAYRTGKSWLQSSSSSSNFEDFVSSSKLDYVYKTRENYQALKRR